MKEPSKLGLVPPSTVLVTGSSGYIGQSLVAELLRVGACALIVCHYRSNESRARLEALVALCGETPRTRCVFARFDLGCDDAAAIGAALTAATPLPIDAVVNCAAWISLKMCDAQPEAAMKINAPIGLLDALALQRRQPLPRFVQLSTDKVFDGVQARGRGGYDESAATRPLQTYGATKRACEIILAERWCDRAVSLRLSVVLGKEAPVPIKGREMFLDFVASALRRRPRGGATFFDDELLSFTALDDVVRICARFCAAPVWPICAQQILHLGSPRSLSRHGIACRVASHLGISPSNAVAVHSPRIAGGRVPRNTTMNSMAAERVFGPMAGMDRVIQGLPPRSAGL
tara:strand:+ start:1 stop:1038 length:1038 start_codon:yes stop_codon:yes gene_type:complete